jgi:peptidoglycan/LPS O-acetylase OafA/YrhL
VSAHLDGEASMRTAPFLWRRFLRIYPAYWFAFFGILVTVGFRDGTPSGLRSWVTYLALLQTYDGARVGGALTQTWTLAIEVSFYLCLPLYARLVRVAAARTRRAPGTAEAIGVGLLIATSFAWRAAWVVVEHRSGPPTLGPLTVPVLAQFFWLPAFLDLFALGMALAVVSAWSARARARGVARGWSAAVLRAVDTAREHPGVLWGLAGLCYWVTCFHMGLEVPYRRGFRRMEEQTCYAVVAFFLVVPAVLPKADGGRIDGFLRARPVAFVGLVSYAIYLWHQACIGQAFAWLGVPYFKGTVMYPFVVAFPLTVAVSAVSYYLVERPVMRLKDAVQPDGRRGVSARAVSSSR